VSHRWLVIHSLNRRRVAAVVGTFGFLAAAVGAATLAPNYSSPSCLPISARFDAADGGSFVLRVCGELPTSLGGPRFAVRYDLQLRIGLVIPVAELTAPKIDSSRR
jgi:hypothetical protein